MVFHLRLCVAGGSATVDFGISVIGSTLLGGWSTGVKSDGFDQHEAWVVFLMQEYQYIDRLTVSRCSTCTCPRRCNFRTTSIYARSLELGLMDMIERF